MDMKTNAGRAANKDAIRIIAATFGVVFGISGMSHGFFETLQGSVPTGGLFINAIGDAHKMWVHGNEPAFTVIPNFLITGVAAILVGFALILWSIWGLGRKNGSNIFLLLFILLFLVGGGVAQIMFFFIGWGFATRVGKPLKWWRRILPEAVRKVLSRFWILSLVLFSALMIFALEIADFGYVPGIADPDVVSLVMVACVFLGLLFLVLAFISGCAYNIENRKSTEVI